MPTNTDLVTDLPADFEVFGQAVDSSLADLKGGTTGQILSKATNTDMDFVWIANDQGDITGITATSPLTGGGTSGAVTVGIQSASTSQSGAVQLSDSTSTTSSVLASTPTATKAAYDLANTANTTANAAVPKSTVTAKGSIFTATASATPAQLTVGNNGETLVADSSTSTGLRYQGSQAGGKNAIVGGGFDNWQRGTASTTTTNAYTGADRWFTFGLSNANTQRVTLAVGSPATYGVQITSTSGTNSVLYGTALEDTTLNPLRGQTVTLSFYAYCSTSTVSLISYAQKNTTANNATTGGWATITSTTHTITTTPTRYSVTFAIAADSTTAGLRILFGADNFTNGANFVIYGVQLEIGSVATQFSRAGGTIQGETSACQRYYQIVHSFTGNASTTTQIHAPLNFVVPMRTSPSVAGSAALYVSDGTNDFQQSSTNVAFVNGNRVTSQNAQLVMTNFTGLTQWRSYMQVSTLGGDIQLSAEL